jgi:hypothetical protein
MSLCEIGGVHIGRYTTSSQPQHMAVPIVSRSRGADIVLSGRSTLHCHSSSNSLAAKLFVNIY